MPPSKKPSPGSQITLSLGLIIVSIVYALWQYLGTGQQPAITALSPSKQPPTSIQIIPAETLTPAVPPPTQTNTNQTPPPSALVTTTPTPAPTPPPKPAGQYVDGSYTGSPTDAYYGIVQVKAIISGGKIADVQFLQYPSDRSTSRYINSQAMPMLTQEAITAQSAHVNGVSGATATSGAFVQSLASALAKAK